MKASIRQFERVLKTQHPGYKHRMSTILQRPFPTIARLNYLSFQTGTIVRQKLRKFPLPRAWSELDLRVFANDVPPRDNKDSRKKKRNLNDEGGLPLRKSNSSHTIYILGKKAKLRRYFLLVLMCYDALGSTKRLGMLRYPLP